MKRSNQLLASKVLRQLVLPQLRHRCRQSTQELFGDLGGMIVGEPGAQYAFRDNGAKILAVAHCDTVRDDTHFEIVNLDHEALVFSAQLDDRLGVYTILDLLPRLGIVTDILLTENEERGASTAREFATDKQYNWIVEFDRRGETAVTYQYDGFIKAVSAYFRHDIGTYSDIAELEHLGACAVNVGVGYHAEHTGRCYLDVAQYVRQMARFIRFYNQEGRTHYPHLPTEWGVTNASEMSGMSEMSFFLEDRCPSCRTVIQGYVYDGQTGCCRCEECGEPLPESGATACPACRLPLDIVWVCGEAFCGYCSEPLDRYARGA